ncbi:hypothetical protein B0H13DRAFT_2322921 [Mycena leptocephala]|nr:hypothetical protein B0H13DRAFT_2322921 [Mycena leptocephala]
MGGSPNCVSCFRTTTTTLSPPSSFSLPSPVLPRHLYFTRSVLYSPCRLALLEVALPPRSPVCAFASPVCALSLLRFPPNPPRSSRRHPHAPPPPSSLGNPHMATQTTTVIFRSPKKPDRSQEVEFPATHARLYHEGVKYGDKSWDVPITTTDGANLIVERPRAEDRPEARKVVLGKMLHDTLNDQKYHHLLGLIMSERGERDTAIRKERAERCASEVKLQTAILELKQKEISNADVVELHESLDLSLQAFNDIVFAFQPVGGRRVLNSADREYLKEKDLGYITRLVDVPSGVRTKAKKDRCWSKLDGARTRALCILSTDEQKLCEQLTNRLKDGRDPRNAQQHPKPDAATAVARTCDIEPSLHHVLVDFLATNPTRRRLQKDGPNADLRIFAPQGTYKSVKEQKTEFEKLKKELEELKLRIAEEKENEETGKKEKE